MEATCRTSLSSQYLSGTAVHSPAAAVNKQSVHHDIFKTVRIDDRIDYRAIVPNLFQVENGYVGSKPRYEAASIAQSDPGRRQAGYPADSFLKAQHFFVTKIMTNKFCAPVVTKNTSQSYFLKSTVVGQSHSVRFHCT